MLTESLDTLESILGIDLRTLTQNIAGNLGSAGDGRPSNGGPKPKAAIPSKPAG